MKPIWVFALGTIFGYWLLPRILPALRMAVPI